MEKEEEGEILLKSHIHTAISFLPEGGLELTFQRSTCETIPVSPYAQWSGAGPHSVPYPHVVTYPLSITRYMLVLSRYSGFHYWLTQWSLSFSFCWRLTFWWQPSEYKPCSSSQYTLRQDKDQSTIWYLLDKEDRGWGEGGSKSFPKEVYSYLGILHRCINMD